jgi:hypothetical protein
MKILIACEFSGIVRDAFTALGHDVTSCDILPSEKPGKHFQGNVLDIINDGWDLMIAHPPCTYLTVTGNKWFKDQPVRKSGALVGAARREAREQAINFFMKLANAPIKHIAIENPIGVMSTVWRKPDQIIHPWQFGHEACKSTCLWLKNLPLLLPTNVVSKGEYVYYKSGKRCSKWYHDAALETQENRVKIRNRTFTGIAEAMANQWG